jgi:signal peptidase II
MLEATTGQTGGASARGAGKRGSTSWLTFLLALVAILLDQASKWWILAVVMRPPRLIDLAPFLSLVLARNRGVSFSLFRFDADWGPWLLSGLALVIVGWLFYWQWRARSRLVSAAVGLIAGGAIGNVTDRLHARAVTDFIDLHLGDYHWPAFNLADSAITLGVLLLLAEALFARSEKS